MELGNLFPPRYVICGNDCHPVIYLFVFWKQRHVSHYNLENVCNNLQVLGGPAISLEQFSLRHMEQNHQNTEEGTQDTRSFQHVTCESCHVPRNLRTGSPSDNIF